VPTPATSKPPSSRGRADDVAFVCYTSGTTGNPKGAMITHANAIETAMAGLLPRSRVDDETSLLPAHGVGGRRLYTLVMSLVVGFCVQLPGEPGDRAARPARARAPRVLAPPRIWENMLTGVQVRAPTRRRSSAAYSTISRRRRARGDPARATASPCRRSALGHALGEFFVYGPVRDQLGLRRARWASPAAPARARHLPLLPLDRREPQAGLRVHRDHAASSRSAEHARQSDTARAAVPGIEVKIADRGEVLVKARVVFKGYLKNEEATREVIDPTGWFHTGDAGFIDPRGHLVIIDRAKDVGALADGTPFAPQFIENKLKFSPFIREAVAFGTSAVRGRDDRHRPSTVGNWAERRGSPTRRYNGPQPEAEVRALIRDEIREGNETLPEAHEVRRFLLLTKDLEADDAEMTRTRKVRGASWPRSTRRSSTRSTRARRVELATPSPTRTAGRRRMQSRVRIEDVEGRPPMSDGLRLLLLLLSNGVLIGLMYSLIALGFVLVYKATDAINFAQGEFVMIAGFVAAGASWCGGAALGRLVLALAAWSSSASPSSASMLRKLIGRPVIAVVMATIGLASILRGVGPFRSSRAPSRCRCPSATSRSCSGRSSFPRSSCWARR
jgi:hypothetical protein